MRARPGPAVRAVDRLLLARHPPADLPGAGADGRRRLGGRRGRRAEGRPDKKVYAVDRGAAGAGRLAGRADADGAAAQRAGGQAARRVVRRPRAPCSTSCAPTSPTTAPGSRTTSSSSSATTPTRPPSPATSSTSGSSCAAASAWSGSGSSGSPSTSTPTRRTRHRCTDDYPHLLAPITLGDLTLRNRVVMGSMHTGLEDRVRDLPAARGVLRRAGPRRRRPDRHRRLRAEPSAAGSSRSPPR